MYQISNQNNFDFLRVFFAFIVMIAHTLILSNIIVFETTAEHFDLMSKIAVDSFFVVSGFLIFMSFENSSSIKKYLIKRIKRIYPAYITVVIVSAIVLFLFSTQSFSEYFSWDLVEYLFYNSIFLNFMHNSLPGVFENNYMHTVNGALWTIKIEVMFYISVPFIALFILKKNKFKGLIFIYLLSVIYSEVCFYLAGDNSQSIYAVLQRQLPGQLTYFISGAFLYYYFEHFNRYSLQYLIMAIIGILISTFFAFTFLFPISLAIVIIYIATKLKFLGNWGKYGDFSYGIYIWHFAIIQIFISLGLFEMNVSLTIIGIIFTVLLLSYISWSFIEKPFLKKKV